AAAGLAGRADHAALGLHDQVERRAVAVGPVLAEAGDRAVDDARVPLARRLVAQAEPGEGAHAVGLEPQVALLDQAEEQRLAFRLLEIDLDALLVAVKAHEVRRLSAG